jgi:CRISPR-associated protein Cmr2
MTNKYLLNVSIGPVQEFIAEARKTRDLWVGSYLLSVVAFRALEPFIEKGCKIIYPAHEESPLYKKLFSKGSVSDEELQVASLPNHFLTVVPNGKLGGLIEASKKSVFQFWKEKTDKVKNRINNEFSSLYPNWNTLWDFQVNDLWQYVWVAIPVSDDELDDNYQEKTKEIQRFLEERKLTRTFKQWEGSTAIKCTQCGHREVLGPDKLKENANFWKAVKSVHGFKGKFRKGDRLCAVCTIKRFIQAKDILKDLKEPGYESTTGIAPITFVELMNSYLDKDKKDRFLSAYNDLAVKLGVKTVNVTETEVIKKIDGIFFYQDELSPKGLIKEFFPHLDKEDIKAIRDKENDLKDVTFTLQEKLKDIYKWAEEKYSLKKITKYYAIVAMDGDKIGEWLSNVMTVSEQGNKSKTLGEMGMIMLAVIGNQWKGRCIYSGGDDLLAFGPLQSSILTVCNLRDEFVKKVAEKISSGMVITHYSNPLGKAIETVRENLQKAKEEYGRDSFVITIQLSSGGTITAGYRWGFTIEGKQIRLVEILTCMVRWMTMRGGLGDGFIYDIISEIPIFYYIRNKKVFYPEMFETEASRLFRQHTPKNFPISASDIEMVIKALSFIADPKNIQREQSFDPEENLINFLRIVSFLVREDIKEI